ncbi:hypothetical protein CVT25_008001, partial [Psilocybe cyanescens]
AEVILIDFEGAGVEPGACNLEKAQKITNKKAKQEASASTSGSTTAAEHALAHLEVERADFEFRIAHAQRQLAVTLEEIERQTQTRNKVKGREL